MNKLILFIAALTLTLVWINREDVQQERYIYQGLTMGTSWHASCVTNDETASILQNTIAFALNEVDQAMSTYKSDSEVSRFSKSSGGIEMSAPSFYVVSVALDIAKKTNGAFDPTVMPLVEMWGFGPGPERQGAPTKAEIAVALKNCGWQHVLLSTDSFFIGKDLPKLQLDLSAIAKGYGADNVAAALENQGVSNYMIEVGGEIRAKGHSEKHRPWRLAIDSPNDENYSRILELSNGAIATSGDYRNTRMIDGKIISHTINPRSGMPVTHNLASVSVIAENCTIADAMATACMVLGADDGMNLIESVDGVEAYFITRTNDKEFSTTESSGFPQALNLD